MTIRLIPCVPGYGARTEAVLPHISYNSESTPEILFGPLKSEPTVVVTGEGCGGHVAHAHKPNRLPNALLHPGDIQQSPVA